MIEIITSWGENNNRQKTRASIETATLDTGVCFISVDCPIVGTKKLNWDQTPMLVVMETNNDYGPPHLSALRSINVQLIEQQAKIQSEILLNPIYLFLFLDH